MCATRCVGCEKKNPVINVRGENFPVDAKVFQLFEELTSNLRVVTERERNLQR